MIGTITTLIPKRKDDDGHDRGGYGFIRDEEDNDRFFHYRDLRDSLKFEELQEKAQVEFEPITVEKGRGNNLRATHVRLA